MKYMTYETDGHIIFVSMVNGNQMYVNKEDFMDKDLVTRMFEENKMNSAIQSTFPYSKSYFKTVYISIHVTGACNLRCQYCFAKNRTDEKTSFENIKKFIDKIVNEYSTAERFIVDLSGSGEPLLELDLLFKISDYCYTKSNEIQKEILPTFVTNGLLLRPETVLKLQSKGFIFGVSIDGDKKQHDLSRIDFNNQGTYKRIMKNVKKITNKEFLGVAMTIKNGDIDLVKSVKKLRKHFSTISIKPVRSTDEVVDSGINKTNIQHVLKRYTDLYFFLITRTLSGDLQYIKAILNGEDYFGKFIHRVLLNRKVIRRCDAGVGRFSLLPNGDIIACPASISIPELSLGHIDRGIDKEKVKNLWDNSLINAQCESCEARYVCGGECFVVSYYKNQNIKSIDPIMCMFKKHIFELAVRFKCELLLNNEDIFYELALFCTDKEERFERDNDLLETHNNVKSQYTFMELKKIKDDFPFEYEKIKQNIL